MNAAATLEATRLWPAEEQLDLVFRLWDQIIDGGHLPPPSSGLLAEIDRRLAAHDADPTRALSWEQVVDHVRGAR